jgi:hypothetical protein
MSKTTASPARKYVALFLATLADKGVAEFKVEPLKYRTKS